MTQDRQEQAEKKTGEKLTPKPPTREEKLSSALRKNLSRRKTQARERKQSLKSE